MARQELYDEHIYNPGGNVATAKIDISERTLSLVAIVFGSISIVMSLISLYGTSLMMREAKRCRSN